jgi:hypothetical protein
LGRFLPWVESRCGRAGSGTPSCRWKLSSSIFASGGTTCAVLPPYTSSSDLQPRFPDEGRCRPVLDASQDVPGQARVQPLEQSQSHPARR